MRYYIVAGEASGDLHASKLIKQLAGLDADATFRGWGGDRMEAEGMTLVKHYRDLAFMGFVEVVANLSTILKNMDSCKADILSFDPDVVILVDYPGFNMRIAKFLHKKGIKTFYYISPQIWAWNQSRVKEIKKHVDRMFVILPFEKAFYKRFDVEVDFVGHPLLDDILELQQPPQEWLSEINPKGLPVVAILPGSRKQEISKTLPMMLSVVDSFPEYQFVIAGAPALDIQFYEKNMAEKHIPILFGQTRQLLKHAEAALITSGTASLEAAIIGTPNVICYHGSFISFVIARLLIKVKYIGLANLIMDRPIVKELIQHQFTTKSVTAELNKLLKDSAYRKEMVDNFELLRERLGGSGASELAATKMFNYLSK